MMERVTVMLCRVGEASDMVEIENSNEGIAKALGCDETELCYITPWSQDVRVIFCDHANRKNRRLHGERGSVEVWGDFIVVCQPRGCCELLPIPHMAVDRYSKFMEVIE